MSYELIGFLITVIFGSFLHFAFELSGYYTPVAIIAAVNESTWEHLKLGFLPILLWGIYEYFKLGFKNKNFVIAKATNMIAFCILVPVIFYSYVYILGKNFLILDISDFVISVAVSQYLGYKIIKIKKDLKLDVLGYSLIIILMFLFIIFTFLPPQFVLFKDPITNSYGIIK
ncbi:MAG: hypothetical protein GYA62_10765 [Bacteroidales bacterium]|nr:hypothetical protein [Bacteroidales bacterium]